MHPPGCEFRYFNPSSCAFNVAVPKNPAIDPRSDEMLHYTNFAIPQNRWSGATGSADYMHPIYWAADLDPYYRIKLTKGWGQNALNGASIRMPRGAKPAGGDDGHLGIVQPGPAFRTINLWQAKVDETLKTITASWGGSGLAVGDGITQAPATAAWFDLAFQVRACELAAANIDHALFCVPTFVEPDPWAPAKGNAQIRADSLWPLGKRPHTGQRLWLDMGWPEIDALQILPYEKAVLRAMSRYGAFVGDTGHYGTVGVSFNVESMQPYETFLGMNPIKDAAKSLGRSTVDIGPALQMVRDRMKWLAKP